MQSLLNVTKTIHKIIQNYNFLFSLQATQSNIYGGAFFQKKLAPKSC